MEESRRSFGADDGSSCIDGATVVVARYKVRVVIAALELETGLENFGRDVDY